MANKIAWAKHQFGGRVCVVAHSNGNPVSDGAARKEKVKMKRGAAWFNVSASAYERPDQLIALNPALDSDHKFAWTWRLIDVFHSPGDITVKFADYLIGHAWGDMGAEGYAPSDGLPEDERVSNHKIEADRSLGTHSSILRNQEVVDVWWPRIVEIIR